MKIEYFEYFITLAQSSSISKAADKLFMSKQQLTRIIDSLETELNVTLLQKTPNGISLTEDGSEFLKYAQNFTVEYASMKNYFALRPKTSNDAILAEPAVCKLYLAPCLAMLSSDIVKSLQKAAPNIKLIIYDKSNKLNEGWFEKNAICFWALEIAQEELCLTNGTLLNAIHLGDISSYFAYNKQFHQFSKSSTYGSELATSTLSHAYEQAMHKESLNLVSSNIYHILDSIVQNNNICGIPDFILPKIKSSYSDISFVPVSTPPSPFHVIYPETYTLTAADEVVINFVQSYIQNLQLLAKQIIENKL